MTSSGTPGDIETFNMVLTHTFDARVSEVWKAWTEGEYIRERRGPSGFTAPLAEMDVREGGTSLVATRAPDEMGGFEHFNTWSYQKIASEERLEFTSRFADQDGTRSIPLRSASLLAFRWKCPTS